MANTLIVASDVVRI